MDIYKTAVFKYVSGDMLVGRPVTMTISRVEIEKISTPTTGEVQEKPMLFFNESKRPLILNNTNAAALAKAFGRETNNWKDKAVELYAEEVKAFGKTHNAARVRVATVQKQTDRLKSETLTPDERKARRQENGSALHAADESDAIGETDKERFARRVMAEIPFYTSQAQVFMTLLGKSLDFNPEIEDLCFDTLATEAQRLADAESAKA